MLSTNDSLNPESKTTLNSVQKPSLSKDSNGAGLKHDSIAQSTDDTEKNRETLERSIVKQDNKDKGNEKYDDDIGRDINKYDDDMEQVDGDKDRNMENPYDDKDRHLEKQGVDDKDGEAEKEDDVKYRSIEKQGDGDKDRYVKKQDDEDRYTEKLTDAKERSTEKHAEGKDTETKQQDPQSSTVTADDTLNEEEWLDILGSGQLRKKVIRKAENSYRPQNLQVCEVNIECCLADGTVIEKVNNFRFQLGDNEVIQGLDLALPLMDVGEEAVLEVGPRFAYSSLGLAPDIPPNATLTYKLELLSTEMEPELETLSVSERSKIGNKKRERGNWWYERQNYTAAIQCYRRAVEYLDETEGGIQIELETNSKIPGEDEHSLLEDRLKVYNNLAAAQMKIKSYDTALESVEKVLTCQPRNVKALFRKGKILAAKGENTAALSVLRMASQLEPESTTIRQELRRLLTLSKKDTKMEKNLYKRMLGQDKGSDTNTSKPSKLFPMRWGVVFGSVAAVLAGMVAYRYKFL